MREGEYAIAAGSQRVVYAAFQSVNPHDLFSAPLDGSAASVRLTGTVSFGNSLRVSPDGRWAAWSLGFDLFVVPVDGSAPPQQVGSSHSLLGAFAFTSDSRRLLYLADQETLGAEELFQAVLGRKLWRSR